MMTMVPLEVDCESSAITCKQGVGGIFCKCSRIKGVCFSELNSGGLCEMIRSGF